MSRSNRIKGGVTDEVFKEQCFLWEGGVSFGAVGTEKYNKSISAEMKSVCELIHFFTDKTVFSSFVIFHNLRKHP